jgi:hypothetical protein
MSNCMSSFKIVTGNFEKTAKFKRKTVLKINPFHSDYKGARFRYRASSIVNEFKLAFQRALYGYDNAELWNMDESFVSRYRAIIEHLGVTAMSHPGELTEEQWKRILLRMIELLDIMGIDEFKVGFPDLILEAAKKKNKAKDQFFRLFSKWFWDLWD